MTESFYHFTEAESFNEAARLLKKAHPDCILHSVCAYASNEGGHLFKFKISYEQKLADNNCKNKCNNKCKSKRWSAA